MTDPRSVVSCTVFRLQVLPTTEQLSFEILFSSTVKIDEWSTNRKSRSLASSQRKCQQNQELCGEQYPTGYESHLNNWLGHELDICAALHFIEVFATKQQLAAFQPLSLPLPFLSIPHNAEKVTHFFVDYCDKREESYCLNKNRVRMNVYNLPWNVWHNKAF